MLREFQEEIARLKAHLENKGPGGGGGGKKKKRRRTKRGPDGRWPAFYLPLVLNVAIIN